MLAMERRGWPSPWDWLQSLDRSLFKHHGIKLFRISQFGQMVFFGVVSTNSLSHGLTALPKKVRFPCWPQQSLQSPGVAPGSLLPPACTGDQQQHPAAMPGTEHRVQARLRHSLPKEHLSNT